jgi:N-acetylmuramic acid 6-phosphate (MurNAc-6-P) etherase
MVNVHLKNEKLAERGVSILERAGKVSRKAAQQALKSAGNSVPVALVMLQSGASRAQAQQALQAVHGHVRHAAARVRKR